MEMLSSNARPMDLAAQAQMAADRAGFDVVKVLWRWKWLPILGTILGLGVGFLVYSRKTPQYAASALVQVISPIPPSTTRLNPYDRDEMMQVSRADESMVISSPTVLKKAIKALNKENYPRLKVMNDDAILGWILTPKMLKVQPAAKEINTTLIDITFICDDINLAAAVVNAIVEGYDEYLTEEFQSMGDTVKDLIGKAAEDINIKYEAMKKEEYAFRTNPDTPVLVQNENGKDTDSFTENYFRINELINEIDVKRQLLLGTLDAVKVASEAKRDPEAISLMVSGLEPSLNTRPELNNASLLPPPGTRPKRESEVLQSFLIELLAEEKSVLNRYGENFPIALRLHDKIKSMQERIAKTVESEKIQEAEEKRRMQEFLEDQPARVKPLTAAERLSIQVGALNETYASLGRQKAELTSLAEENKKRAKEIEIYLAKSEMLASERRSYEMLQGGIRDKLNQISVLPPSNQRDLKELMLPEIGRFYGPKLLPYLFGGGVLGFCALAGIAVLLDFADKSFRTPDEIAADMGVPVLGHIPAMEASASVKKAKANEAVDASICTIHHSKGRVSESYRSIRTGLFFSNRSGDLKVIQITSPVPGDGKSTLSSNLAVTMAQSGRRVLLIDADFRRPRIAKLFGISGDIGMATVVAGNAELDEAIHLCAVPNLSIMPGGKRPSNPAELLSSQRFSDLMQMLRDKFDIIVVDTPPLLAVSDPSAIAAVVDGVVMTMRLRRNVKPLAMRACKILESVDANVLGVVINGVSANAGYGYSYSYSDYRYAYRYRYGNNYYAGGYKGGYDYGAKAYLEENHDVDNEHVMTPRQNGQDA